jgi:hypothetical protein
MLPEEPKIWLLADKIVDRHGAAAPVVIQAWAANALKRDDFGEYLVWRDILAAVAALSASAAVSATIH